MGRLIPNQNSTFTSLVHCKDEDEFLQLRFQLGSRVLKVDFDQRIVYFTSEREKRLRGAYHVHAYILDYQQIEFAEKAMSVPFDSILKVKVDCLVLRKPSKQYLAETLASKSAFSVEQILGWLEEHTGQWKIGELKGFDGWNDSVNEFAPTKWTGFHEERVIKDTKTPHINDTDFTHRHFVSNIQLADVPVQALHKFIEVTGSAGCAKTYTATHWNLWNACILVPTNGLRVKFARENPGIPCSTYHK